MQPERAEQAIEDVAELFRAALQTDSQDSSLAQECRLCELYLAIEQLRLGERLSVSWDIDDALRDIPLPSLLLQPLVVGQSGGVYRATITLPLDRDHRL